MDVNSLVISTLTPLGYPVEFMAYEGKETKYITFNFEDERAEFYADNEPQEDVAYLQIHFFSPQTYNHLADKKRIKVLLYKAGFSYPSIQTFREDETKYNHIVFQCHIAGASEREE